MTQPVQPWAYLRLSRPPNLLIVGISVAVGGAVSQPRPDGALLAAIASGILIAAGGNALNDYFDREIDRVNKPHRPIPSGSVSPGGTLIFSAACFLLGWVAGLWVGPAACALVSSWVVLLVLYGRWIKMSGVAGNLLVSAVSGSAFLLGGLAAERPHLSLIPAGLAFLFHMGREIIKDTQDLPGDMTAGVQSLAVRYGKDRALAVAAVVFALLMIATPLPFLAGVYNETYFIAVIVGVDLPLLYVVRSILGKPTEDRLGRLSALLKADMIVGIACILIGSGVIL